MLRRLPAPAVTAETKMASAERGRCAVRWNRGVIVYRRNTEAIKRSAERKKREDKAERLLKKVPNLKSLSIHISEKPVDGKGYEISYVKRVVVDHAPALFVIPCVERSCAGGGHDLTRKVLNALKKGKTEFTGNDRCEGTIDGEECTLELSFVAEASYA